MHVSRSGLLRERYKSAFLPHRACDSVAGTIEAGRIEVQEPVMPLPSSAELVQGLTTPTAYPWRPHSVNLIETHISWVFLAGDRVLKIKRPVAFGFVDHRTIALRKHSCDEEVRLNRRLTDDVYLGVVPIVWHNGAARVNGTGEPVEWGTLMRRLPADRMLDQLIVRGETPPDLATRLTARLLPFHRDVIPPCVRPSDGSPDALASVLTGNLDELQPFASRLLGRAQLDLIDRSVRSFLIDSRPLLASRSQRWVRDGHGDLRAEHVCLESDGRTQIFDCVEFNPAIRCADVASDLAFLTMDLRRLGAGSVADDMVGRYRLGGVELPAALLALYETHRALVRAKIACLTHVSAGQQRHPSMPLEAERYLDLALQRGVTRRPVLMAMTGFSGSGKSTVAIRLADALGAVRVTSDVIRDELAGAEAGPAAFGQGAYHESWTRRTYDEMLARCRHAIAAGSIAIADAAFLDGWQRTAAADLARDRGVPFLLVETVASDEIAERRLLARQARGDSASDADVAIRRRQIAKAVHSPVEPPAACRHVVVDTSGEKPAELDAVIEALVESGALVSRIPG